MAYLLMAAVLVAACAMLGARALACVREERLEQRVRLAPPGVLRPSDPAVAALGGRRGERPGRVRPAAAPRERDSPHARRLRAAGIGLAPVWWTGLVAGGAVSAGFVAAAISGMAAAGLGVAAAVPAGARAWLRRRARKRGELLDVQLAHALPQVAASLRGSLTLERALRVALVHMDDPLRGEISRVLADATYGMPLHEALEAMARRTQSEDVRTLASAARMRQNSGGSVAAALAMISARVNARLKAKRELKVEVAGTRMAKWFVAGSMPAIFLIMYVTNADFARFYATEPLGWAVLGGAAALEAIGLFAAHAVTSLERY